MPGRAVPGGEVGHHQLGAEGGRPVGQVSVVGGEALVGQHRVQPDVRGVLGEQLDVPGGGEARGLVLRVRD